MEHPVIWSLLFLVAAQLFWQAARTVASLLARQRIKGGFDHYVKMTFLIDLLALLLWWEPTQNMFWSVVVPTNTASVICSVIAYYLLKQGDKADALLQVTKYRYLIPLFILAWAGMSVVLVLLKGYSLRYLPPEVAVQLIFETFGSIVYVVTFRITWWLLNQIPPKIEFGGE